MADAEAFNRPPRQSNAKYEAAAEQFRADKAAFRDGKLELAEYKTRKRKFGEVRRAYKLKEDKKVGLA